MRLLILEFVYLSYLVFARSGGKHAKAKPTADTKRPDAGGSEIQVGVDASHGIRFQPLASILLFVSASALRLPDVISISCVSMRPPQRSSIRMQADDGQLLNLLSTSEPNLPSEDIVLAIEEACQSLPTGARLTAADLATKAGISIDEASTGMKELAAAIAGAKGVSVAASSKGDLLYSFPPNVRKALASRSALAQLRDEWKLAKFRLASFSRLTFGVAIFVSIAVNFLTIATLNGFGYEETSAPSRCVVPLDSATSRKNLVKVSLNGKEFTVSRGYLVDKGIIQEVPAKGYPTAAEIVKESWERSPLGSFIDVLKPRFPYGYYGYGWFKQPPRMSLPESIFSFVFGDGDPNVALRATRLRGLAEVIRANGGAVIAEQLAPFLDPPALADRSSGAGSQPIAWNPFRLGSGTSCKVDESWVLPAVIELGGRPEVTSDGTIVYLFDDLKVSGIASDALVFLADPALASIGSARGFASMASSKMAKLANERAIALGAVNADSLREQVRSWADQQLEDRERKIFSQDYLVERKAPFSNAAREQLNLAGALGVINLMGVTVLGFCFADEFLDQYLLEGWLGVVQDAYPLLVTYAVSYLTIPFLRWFQLNLSNYMIERRNCNRRQWRDALQDGSDVLKKRLAAASQWREQLRFVREDDVDYDSAKELGKQRVAQQPDLDDFDRRLRNAPRGDRAGTAADEGKAAGG